MMGAVDGFADVGVDLLRLAASLTLSTRGTFSDTASSALVIVTAYCEAGRNGFALLAADTSAPNAQRLAAMQACGWFVVALETIATQIGTSGTVATLAPLASGAIGGGLASMFPISNPIVSITPAAQAAVDALRRDPLTFILPATATVKALMSAASNGIGIAA